MINTKRLRPSFALSMLKLMTFVLASLASLASAQSYPTKPIRLVVPWPAGGLVDVAARQFAKHLQPALGQPVVVDNKPGAAGSLGADQVSKASADGHTLLFSTSALNMNAALRPKLPFDATQDLERVALLAYAPSVLVVSTDSPIKSVQQLIESARKQPGRLSYGSAGVGSPAHLTGELFKSKHQLFVVHIPYSGGPGAMTDQLAGRIDYHFPNLTVALPHLRSGKLRALAVTSSQRVPSLPEVPTMSETANERFEADQWLGLLAPKATPTAVIDLLVATSNKILSLEDFNQALSSAGISSAKPGRAESFETFFVRDLAQWKSLVKSANIVAE